MMKKMFVEIIGTEGKNWGWRIVDTNYSSMVEVIRKMDTKINAVRVVERIFDEKTFSVEEKIIKETVAVFDCYWNKTGKVEEIIY